MASCPGEQGPEGLRIPSVWSSHPDAPIIVNDMETPYFPGHCVFFCVSTFRIHSFWETKLVEFTFCFLWVPAWLESKKLGFQQQSFMRVNVFFAEKPPCRFSQSRERWAELKMGGKWGLSGHSSWDHAWRRSLVIPVSASWGREIPTGRKREDSRARVLSLVCLDCKASSVDFLLCSCLSWEGGLTWGDC